MALAAAAALMITSNAQEPTDVVDGTNDGGAVGGETDPSTIPPETENDTTTEENTTGGVTPAPEETNTDEDDDMTNMDGDGDGATPITESEPFDPEEIINWGTEETNDMTTQPIDPDHGHTDDNGEIPQADTGAHDGDDDDEHGGHFLGASTLATSASALVVLASLLAM